MEVTARTLEKLLLHNRYTIEELEQELQKIDSTFKLSNASEDEIIPENDYMLNFSGKKGYGSIWYAITTNNRYYITEIYYKIDNT